MALRGLPSLCRNIVRSQLPIAAASRPTHSCFRKHSSCRRRRKNQTYGRDLFYTTWQRLLRARGRSYTNGMREIAAVHNTAVLSPDTAKP